MGTQSHWKFFTVTKLKFLAQGPFWPSLIPGDSRDGPTGIQNTSTQCIWVVRIHIMRLGPLTDLYGTPGHVLAPKAPFGGSEGLEGPGESRFGPNCRQLVWLGWNHGYQTLWPCIWPLLQPMQLCIFSGRPFEATFENAQWRKVKQMQPMRLYIIICKFFEDSFKNTQWRKNITWPFWKSIPVMEKTYCVWAEDWGFTNEFDWK